MMTPVRSSTGTPAARSRFFNWDGDRSQSTMTICACSRGPEDASMVSSDSSSSSDSSVTSGSSASNFDAALCFGRSNADSIFPEPPVHCASSASLPWPSTAAYLSELRFCVTRPTTLYPRVFTRRVSSCSELSSSSAVTRGVRIATSTAFDCEGFDIAGLSLSTAS